MRLLIAFLLIAKYDPNPNPKADRKICGETWNDGCKQTGGAHLCWKVTKHDIHVCYCTATKT
jgi:hypothetical protein